MGIKEQHNIGLHLTAFSAGMRALGGSPRSGLWKKSCQSRRHVKPDRWAFIGQKCK
jgi:hypothetical protein